jgi:hypothetical protein
MKRFPMFWAFTSITSVAALLATSSLLAQNPDPNQPKRLDRGKHILERPVKFLAASDIAAAEAALAELEKPASQLSPMPRVEESRPAIELDYRKMVIQGPVKRAIAGAAPAAGGVQPAQEALPVRVLDRRKGDIETPVKQAIAAAAPADRAAAAEAAPAPALVERKSDIQGPVKKAIARTTGDTAAQQAEAQVEEEVVSTKDDNPKVAPGIVRWHDDFAAACKAAATSGKPVLLFQMLGQLDQRFT